MFGAIEAKQESRPMAKFRHFRTKWNAKFVGPRDWYNQGTVQYLHDVSAGRRTPVG